MRQRMGQRLESDRTTTEKIVLIALLCDQDVDGVSPVLTRRLIRQCSISERTLARVLKTLRGQDVISREVTHEGRSGASIDWGRL